MRIICLSIFILLAFQTQQSSRGERLVSEVLKQDRIATSGTDKYAKTLGIVTAGTKFEGKWQINQPIRENHLNLYVLRPGLAGQPGLPEDLSNLLGGCAQLGEKNLVFCDDGFINNFLEKHNVERQLKSRPNEQLEWQSHKEMFLLWVLGHELGHIVKKHGLAHFESNNLEKYVATSTLGQREELEADAFITEQVGKDSELSRRLTNVILDFLNAEIIAKIGPDIPYGVGILYDYTDEKVVTYTRLKTHPEYVIRLTRILQQLGNLKGNEGLKGMADAFARQMKEGY